MLTERTLLLIKPDGVRRGLIGAILSRVERSGLAIVRLTMQVPSPELATQHYPTSAEQLRSMGSKLLVATRELGLPVIEVCGTEDPIEAGRVIHERNVAFLTSGAVVAAVVEGPNAVRKLRSVCGATLPAEAAPGSIRGDFGCAGAEAVLFGGGTVENLVHSSEVDGEQHSARREIALWFGGTIAEDHFGHDPHAATRPTTCGFA